MTDEVKADGAGDHLVRCRGLPWSITVSDVQSFFHDVKIRGEQSGIHLVTSVDGRPSGECFVEVMTEEDVGKAVAHSNENIGRRYVEVFSAKRAEMDWAFRDTPTTTKTEAIARLRGLPFGATKEEIAHFFSGLEIVPNGITQVVDRYGRAGGEAYVEFSTPEGAEKALLKHKESLGHRYIEVFASTRAEMMRFAGHQADEGGYCAPPPLMGRGGGRPGPYDRPQRGGGYSGARYNDNNSGYDRQYRGGGRGGRGYGRGGYGGSDDGYGGGGNNYNTGGGYGGRGRGNDHPPAGPNATMVHMRGLPYSATEQAVKDFFQPECPTFINVLVDHSGRPSGTADVSFNSPEEAQAAMRHDRQSMGHRYIELFLRDAPGDSDHRVGPGPQRHFGNPGRGNGGPSASHYPPQGGHGGGGPQGASSASYGAGSGAPPGSYGGNSANYNQPPTQYGQTPQQMPQQQQQQQQPPPPPQQQQQHHQQPPMQQAPQQQMPQQQPPYGQPQQPQQPVGPSYYDNSAGGYGAQNSGQTTRNAPPPAPAPQYAAQRPPAQGYSQQGMVNQQVPPQQQQQMQPMMGQAGQASAGMVNQQQQPPVQQQQQMMGQASQQGASYY